MSTRDQVLRAVGAAGTADGLYLGSRLSSVFLDLGAGATAGREAHRSSALTPSASIVIHPDRRRPVRATAELQRRNLAGQRNADFSAEIFRKRVRRHVRS